MDWDEISRRLRNGTSVSVLAELAGTTYKNMYNRIRRREQIDGKQYLKPDQLKRPYKAQGGRKKAAFLEKKLHIPEEKKAVDITKYNCETCANVIARPESYSCTDGHVEIEKHCTKGMGYGGRNCVCSEYITSALEPFIKPPEEKKNVTDPGPAASNSSNVILCESCRHFCPGTETTRPYCKKYEHMCGLIYVCEGYAAGGPEVEPIGEEKAPARPEVVEKVADVPEVVREFAGIPEGVVKDTLERYRKEQADAVREMHAIETMYKLQKAKEMKLRTVVLALERLLEGE